MPRAKKKTNNAIDFKPPAPHPEAKGIIFLAAAFVLFLSLASFAFGEPSRNWLGLVGYGLGYSLNYVFGITSAYSFLFLGWIGWAMLAKGSVRHLGIKSLYLLFFTLSSCILLSLIADESQSLPRPLIEKVYSEMVLISSPFPHQMLRSHLGGVPFYYLYSDLPIFNLKHLLSNVGVGITFSLTALVSLILLTNARLSKIWQLIRPFFTFKWLIKLLKGKEKEHALKAPDEIEETLTRRYQDPPYKVEKEEIIEEPLEEEKEPLSPKLKLFSEKLTKKKLEKGPSTKEEAIEAQKVYNGDFKGYKPPPLTALRSPKKVDHPSLQKELRNRAVILEETLGSFGIEAKVGNIHCGPTITSFEVHPAVGVKVQKIKALENDIALNLQAKTIRIIAPIPGKAAVGVEVPSLNPQEVSFREMLSAYQKQKKKLQIPVILGKTVTGENVISDLARMPHCIIAGATGSGKSVCINILILSILMNARPDEIKLLLVDPKKVELSAFTKLPHLVAPVITEPHGAYAALNWLVKEMQNRYEILKQLGVRNINAFNNRKINKEKEEALKIKIPEQMPSIVAIIDEFADLMMVSSTDLETPIARIAQMARAVGIHLVLATQRPSREVITGLIKANFPTRIAFKVASRINSQIILDEVGAESLLGNGDMLFLPPGTSHLTRAQGAFVSDDEIHKIVEYICEQAPPNYLIESFDAMKPEESKGESSEGKDPLYEEALNIVLANKSASTTFLQRKLKVGYARAASLIDELEAKGVIGPADGARPRKVLGSFGD